MSGRSNVTEADTIIVGAGIVGCSLAMHLAQRGHRDVVVLDRGKLNDPLGSTGHAPGLLCRNSPSASMSAMAKYTASLLADLPKGQPAMAPVGSLEVTRDSSRIGDLTRKAEMAKRNGLDARLVSPAEIGDLVPYLERSVLAGGLLVRGDGSVEVRRGLQALHDQAVLSGAVFQMNTEVQGFTMEGDRVTGVVTPSGKIACKRVVIATGIWGSILSASVGIDLPILPVQHPYLVTEALPFLEEGSGSATRPIIRDVDRYFYMREHGNRLGYGWYNHGARDCDVGRLRKAELDYPDIGFDEALDYDLVPGLRDALISRRLNGVFSMTPDGGPLLGPVPGRDGIWIAAAVWVTHAGGATKALSDLMLGTEPTIDLSPFSPDRFGPTSSDVRRQASLRLYDRIYDWPTESAIGTEHA